MSTQHYGHKWLYLLGKVSFKWVVWNLKLIATFLYVITWCNLDIYKRIFNLRREYYYRMKLLWILNKPPLSFHYSFLVLYSHIHISIYVCFTCVYIYNYLEAMISILRAPRLVYKMRKPDGIWKQSTFSINIFKCGASYWYK